MSTTVNEQITDAVAVAPITAVNPQITDAAGPAAAVPAGAPQGVNVGQLYQELSYATGLLLQNAVAAQQQQAALAQAAAAQGVMQIYTLDNATGAAQSEQISEALRVSSARLDAAVATLPAGPRPVDAALAAPGSGFDSGDAAYRVRAAADALAASIAHINRVQHENLLHILELAASAACLAAMVRAPEQAAAYDAVLETIRSLGR